MNRVKPKRIFGGVKKRKDSPLLLAIRESEKQAAILIAEPMAHEMIDESEVMDALRRPVRAKVSDPTSIPLEEIEARKSRHTYQAPEDRQDGALRKLYLTKAPDSREVGEPYVEPNADALEFAAHYLAGVVCASNEHHVPLPPWPYEFPCKLCFSWAVDRLHDLATYRFPIQELADARQKTRKNPGAKARAGRSGTPSRNPVSG